MQTKAVVLIADDEQTNIDLVSQILLEEYDLKVAHNGEKVLRALEKFHIDLVLLDIQMPKMDGFEVAKEIRSQSKYDHIPIIFLSSQNDKDSIVEGFDLGGNDYITKPFSPKELIARVQTHLHVHQLQNFLEMMLNLQSSLILVSDGKNVNFINQTGLNFFGCKDIEEFVTHLPCLEKAFIKMTDCYFHNPNSKTDWISEIQKLPPNKRLIALYSNKKKLKIFRVAIRFVPGYSMFVLDLSDITESIKEQKQLENKIIHDTLTGAYNREYFERNITKLATYKRYDDELKVIVFLDIDHFKNINDTFGHEMGDTVLKRFVQVLQQNSRKNDTLIRWGGEEFIIILTLANFSLIEPVLEKFRLAIAGHEFVGLQHITCSIGATILQKSENIHEAIKRADAALYHSKNSGRNRTTIL